MVRVSSFPTGDGRIMQLIKAILFTALMFLPSAHAQNPSPVDPRSPKDRAAYSAGDVADLQYQLGPDSLSQRGVPRGTITEHRLEDCSAYPGNPHDYWVYVPKQYNAQKPACLMVFTDGPSYLNNYKA